jgi:hypothetical protein
MSSTREKAVRRSKELEMRRVLPFFVLALLAYVVSPALAQDKATKAKNTHRGVVVSVVGNKLTMVGRDRKEHTHTVASDAKISCDGKECKLSDLKKGAFIEVTTKEGDPNTATAIKASTKRPTGGGGTK